MHGTFISELEQIELPEINTSCEVLISQLEKIKSHLNLDVNIETQGYCNASSNLYGYFKLLKKEKFIINLTKLICLWDGHSDIKEIANEFFNLYEITQNSLQYLSNIRQNDTSELISFIKSESLPDIERIATAFPLSKEQRIKKLSELLHSEEVLFIKNSGHIICVGISGDEYCLHDSENSSFERKFKNIEILEEEIIKALHPDVEDSMYLPMLMYSYRLKNRDLRPVQISDDEKIEIDEMPQDILDRVLFLAVSEGELSVANMLISYGADINYQAQAGFSLLHIAAQNGHQQVVNMLLDNKVNPDTLNRELFTPLYLAAKHGHEEVVKLLVAYKSDVNTQVSRLKFSPLFHASYHNYPTALRTLLKFNSDTLSAAGKFGNTAAHAAAKLGYLEILVILGEAGANLNAQTNKKTTPLHLAVSNGHVDIVKYLIEKGVDIDLQDENNHSALEIVESKAYKDPSTKEILIDLLRSNNPINKINP
ncbi:hypothetical protein TUM19329_10330 [Legionella antarctica]|uniref:Uncharacterized protein n=1 Tax=Legionella antarctica TaxID=2708020 RepID=A0A6F8T3S2_9GAMM|nr:ankyrin repeat domain-containing protein [Legionella antarctica]BCA94672.1 hypothetical protein TUM19329_10330 [Legionella antarctica]